jgi:hypothetical protein
MRRGFHDIHVRNAVVLIRETDPEAFGAQSEKVGD